MALVVDGVRADVASVGELGDEVVAEVAERIADLLVRSLPARVLELLSDVAAEVSGELPDGRVEIRVAGGARGGVGQHLHRADARARLVDQPVPDRSRR
jgi:hypothetical protein